MRQFSLLSEKRNLCVTQQSWTLSLNGGWMGLWTAYLEVNGFFMWVIEGIERVVTRRPDQGRLFYWSLKPQPFEVSLGHATYFGQ